MASKADSGGCPDGVPEHRTRFRGALMLFRELLMQHPEDVRACLEAKPAASEEVGAERQDDYLASLWRQLDGRKWWALERNAMVAVAAHNLVLELVDCHKAQGGLTEELQWACTNLGHFAKLFGDTRGLVAAGLFLAVDDLDEHLPEYIREILMSTVGANVLEPASVPYG